MPAHSVQWSLLWTLFALGSVVLVTACTEGEDASCGPTRSCPAGERCADGVCTPELTFDGDIPVDLGRSDAPHADLADDLSHADQSGCVDDEADPLSRAEYPVSVGAKARYSVGEQITVDLVGVDQGGTRTWDLSAAAAEEREVTAELLPVFAWAQAEFPDASYASLLDESLQTYGLFRVTQSALQLAAVVSAEAGPTKLLYDSPVDLLRFPVKKGQSYTTASNVSGPINSVWVWLHESYQVTTLDQGRLKLPSLTFEALLVQVVQTQYPVAAPLMVTQRTQYLFVSPCYGTVARVLTDGVPSELSAVQAKERWRLTF